MPRIRKFEAKSRTVAEDRAHKETEQRRVDVAVIVMVFIALAIIVIAWLQSAAHQ